VAVYSAVTASCAKPEADTSAHRAALALGPPPEFKIQTVGRSLPRVETPEGWIKKVDRHRRQSLGRLSMYGTIPDGLSVRLKKEKTLSPATKPEKH
jgi:hypothetical protein